ncbi:hypothetical protein SCUCBS95973_002391 [Sporothrix curviconia]|uniref:Peptidase A1 domain-containing protein n=1 Tax=Sporothrix curviconia TaxID=1260050 RepID=A0ABP0B6F6_9PEZI
MALRLCAVLLGAAASVSGQAIDVSAVSDAFPTVSTVSASPVPLSTSTAAAAAAATTATTATAEDMQDGCIHFQIVHSTNTAHFGKRAVELTLANRSDVAYYAKLNFGTPAQAQYVQLDTGSFELWVNPTCTTGLSAGDASFCEAVGHFDTSSSSTFASLGVGKQLQYGIGSANITYVTDDISLPGTSSVLSQVQFGVATSTTDEFSGILGIGYGLGLTTRYPNFVDELALQNVTKVKAFSLALGSKTEQEGVIVFGGVDTSKFAGKLARLPITPAKFSPDGVPRYWVNMTGMSLTTPAGASKAYADSALQVFLDSGSTLTLLPTDLANSIASDFGATDGPNSDGFYTVDCSLVAAAGTGSLDFAFAGTTIRVPYSELIRQSGSACMLGLQASTDFVLLGDTFLRSAYVVIDQTDNVVWMAPYTNCGSTPAALASAGSLATLTGACAQSNSLDVSGASGSDESSSLASSTAASTKTTLSPTQSSAAVLVTAVAKTATASQSAASSASSGVVTSAASVKQTGRGQLAGVVVGVIVAMFGGSLLDWL